MPVGLLHSTFGTRLEELVAKTLRVFDDAHLGVDFLVA